jgi:hypothetical protein
MRTRTVTVNDKMQNGCRHVRHCEPGHLTCRARQRQAPLHWAYDSWRI